MRTILHTHCSDFNHDVDHVGLPDISLSGAGDKNEQPYYCLASRKVVDTLIHTSSIDRSVTFCYMPTLYEPNILPLIKRLWSHKHIVCVPRCRHGEECIMDAVQITPTTRRRRSNFLIREPIIAVNDVMVDSVSTVLVPCLAFDTCGARIGHGKGYYDVRLGTHSYGCAVGVGFVRQRVKPGVIPMTDNDVWLDNVVYA